MTTPTTIFALSTLAGRSGIAIIRISGPEAGPALARLCREGLPAPRRATLRDIRDPADGSVIDQAVVLYFPAPHSFTGEDVIEIQCHGSKAVIDGLLGILAALPGLTLAGPGDFTRRAFEHGRMDLTQIEGLADLINAETEQQRRQAQRQLSGELGALYDGWRQVLTRALAYLELSVDFPDEDTPDDTRAHVLPDVTRLEAGISAHLAESPRAERLRDGVRMVLAGAPNAGKSTLLNALARRDVAIVSEQPGTTRDVLEIHLDLDGIPVILSDTAGLRALPDEPEDGAVGDIEREGMARARRQLDAADLRIAVVDGTASPLVAGGAIGDPSAYVVSKSDLLSAQPRFEPPDTGGIPVFVLSARTGDGMAAFLSFLTDQAKSLAGVTAAPSATRLRHRTELAHCRDSLRHFIAAPGDHLPELAAEDIRVAIRALGRITGAVEVDDLLDVIFRDFCIGK